MVDIIFVKQYLFKHLLKNESIFSIYFFYFVSFFIFFQF